MTGELYTALDGLRFGIVDDNAYFRRLLRGMLGGIGVRQIAEAVTPDEGFELLLRARPDILLLDWQFGAGTGVALLDRIRTHPKLEIATQAVVFVSAHSDRSHVLHAIERGANDFLVKPVSARFLYDRIRRLTQMPMQYYRQNGRLRPIPHKPKERGSRIAVMHAPAGRAAAPARPVAQPALPVTGKAAPDTVFL